MINRLFPKWQELYNTYGSVREVMIIIFTHCLLTPNEKGKTSAFFLDHFFGAAAASLS